MIGSLRLKLVAWNLVVLAGAFLTFGLLLSYANVQRLRSDIDRELEMRGRHTAGLDRGPAPPMGGGAFGRGPGDMPPPDFAPRGQGENGPGRPGGPPEALFDLRRPRFADGSGNPIGMPSYNQPFDRAALQNALEGKAQFSTITIDGEPVRVYSCPWLRGDRFDGAVQVARELRDVELLRAGQLRTLMLLLPLALIAAGVGAFFLATRVLKPIGDLTRAAREITATDLSRRLDAVGDDEFAQLTSTFNEMVARLELSFTTLNQAYHDLEVAYERQKQFTADASHELRTPLTRLKLATSSALNGESQEQRSALENADKAATAMATLVDQLLLLAQADAKVLPSAGVELDMRVPVAETVDSFASERIRVDLPTEPVQIVGDEELVRRLVRNLVENALRYSGESSKVEVALDQNGTLTVADEGPGITAEHLPHLFERFYRVDPARSRGFGGSGLGLAICKSIVEALGGSIEVQSFEGKGSVFTVRLPTRRK